METVGDNIKKFRLLKNYTNLEFSKVSGLSRSYILELEKGVYKNIGMNVICKLCKALDITPNELIPEHKYKKEVD